MKPEVIADYDNFTGEGPLWHSDEQCLYWVDIPQGRLFRYDPASGEHAMVYEGRPIGGFTFQTDGSFLLFMDKGAIAVWRNGEIENFLIESIPEEMDSRFNDVIADPAGRVFCGTMPSETHPASLYRLDLDGSIHKVLGDVGLSNGLGFTPDRKQMYYTDTHKHVIYIFDYDEATGEISNQRDFAVVPREEGEGHPDGMTVDAAGDVWSARWDGHCLVRYKPDGTEVERVTFPAPKVSCVTFGGPDTTDMYVTTASVGNKEQEGPLAGALFRINLGVKGVPEFMSRVKVKEQS